MDRIALRQQKPVRGRKPDASFSLPGTSRPKPGKFLLPGAGTYPPTTASDACLHELFEAQVEAAPNAEALVSGARRLNYHELNLLANDVAHRLRSLGVGPETIVGIFMERSAEMVIAILGVLKAGGAYLPMDPAYPSERLAFMLEDTQAQAILSQSSLSGILEGLTPRRLPVLCLDVDGGFAFANTKNPGLPVQPCNQAYVIYTSGSTGTPKGVVVEHRNAVALVQWADQVYSARELDGVLAGVSICFDPSILDLFVPLCLGGRTIVAANTLALPGLAETEEIRLINTVPSVMQELLRIGGIPASLETVNLGGEPLSMQLVDQIYSLTHVKRVYDLYGPTEAATCSTFALRPPSSPATIGRPIAQTQVYLLDEDLRPVPTGSSGELFIGGAGVARGYLNRPELTAEKFITLSLPGGGTTRVYRTGDFCRLRFDGNLEFVGRKDQQVKVRGFRVEVGEIESALMIHPAVAQAVVIAHEEAPGERRLIAYLVIRAEAQTESESHLASSLRSHLQARLPDYMLPSAFIPVDRFNLTPNGKVDRAVLPAPVRTRATTDDYVAPRTPTEDLLCGIWIELLGLKQIGIDDDFFHLGGDSLLFTSMLTQVEEKTDVKLPMEAIQKARSVRRFAAFLEKKRAGRQPAANFPGMEIQPRGSRPPLFLIHGLGGGMLWGYANLARHLGPDQPVYAFKDPSSKNSEAFDTIETMAARYVEDLQRFQPEGPYALGGYCFGGVVAYEMARQLEAKGQRVSLLALMNSAPPDSRYHRFSWTPRQTGKFLCNFGYWLYGFLGLDSGKRRKFLRWKWKALKGRARRSIGPAPLRSTSDLDERIDISGVPADQRFLWEAHFKALDCHHTRPYGGEVLLLRTRCHPKKCSFEPLYGWDEFARGVKVRVFPSLHDNLLEEPYVEAVARELKACLDEAQSNPPR